MDAKCTACVRRRVVRTGFIDNPFQPQNEYRVEECGEPAKWYCFDKDGAGPRCSKHTPEWSDAKPAGIAVGTPGAWFQTVTTSDSTDPRPFANTEWTASSDTLPPGEVKVHEPSATIQARLDALAERITTLSQHYDERIRLWVGRTADAHKTADIALDNCARAVLSLDALTRRVAALEALGKAVATTAPEYGKSGPGEGRILTKTACGAKRQWVTSTDSPGDKFLVTKFDSLTNTTMARHFEHRGEIEDGLKVFHEARTEIAPAKPVTPLAGFFTSCPVCNVKYESNEHKLRHENECGGEKAAKSERGWAAATREWVNCDDPPVGTLVGMFAFIAFAFNAALIWGMIPALVEAFR